MNAILTNRIAIAVATLAAAAALVPAAHAAAGDPPSVVLKYSAANVATEQGARELYRRIAAAADEVCPVEFGHNPALAALARQCRLEAIAHAVGSVPERRLVDIAARAHRG